MDDVQPNEKSSSVLTGVAGEYFVAAELTRRGYIASITLRNTRGVDILCSNMDASRSVGIQVKTNRHSNRAWMLNKKSEDYFADNLFYVFVNLNDNKREPDYFIVPSETVGTTPLTGERAQTILRGRPRGRLGTVGSGKGCLRGRPRGRFGMERSETAPLPHRLVRLGSTHGAGAIL